MKPITQLKFQIDAPISLPSQPPPLPRKLRQLIAKFRMGNVDERLATLTVGGMTLTTRSARAKTSSAEKAISAPAASPRKREACPAAGQGTRSLKKFVLA